MIERLAIPLVPLKLAPQFPPGPISIPRPDPFGTAWAGALRREILEQSHRALAMTREFGLEMPCERPTT